MTCAPLTLDVRGVSHGSPRGCRVPPAGRGVHRSAAATPGRRRSGVRAALGGFGGPPARRASRCRAHGRPGRLDTWPGAAGWRLRRSPPDGPGVGVGDISRAGSIGRDRGDPRRVPWFGDRARARIRRPDRQRRRGGDRRPLLGGRGRRSARRGRCPGRDRDRRRVARRGARRHRAGRLPRVRRRRRSGIHRRSHPAQAAGRAPRSRGSRRHRRARDP